MDAYLKRRTQHSAVSGALVVGTSTDDSTLASVRNSSYAIYIQRIQISVTTGSSGKTWTFKDSADTPIPDAIIPVDATGYFERDFGPDGVKLSTGKNFLLDVSATGAAGQIVWYGFQKAAAVLTPATA